MISNNKPTDEPEIQVANYCVSFIDLLGQRDALCGQGLLPSVESESEKQKWMATLRASVGSIVRLQTQAADLMRASRPNPNSVLRASLTPEQKIQFDEMMLTKVMTQRWSDGLVSFVCLGDEAVKCHVNSIYELFGHAGALCLIGLCNRRPLRGAIEIAWGVELHPGELYGAAVARAYELESECAQYPRIVIGEEVVKFLKSHSQNTAPDPYSIVDREMAQLCLSMILKDEDGCNLLHYLGEGFRFAITNNNHEYMYEAAKKFVREALAGFREMGNEKLTLRYERLHSYFDRHPAS